jgi:hypothetical protein
VKNGLVTKPNIVPIKRNVVVAIGIHSVSEYNFIHHPKFESQKLNDFRSLIEFRRPDIADIGKITDSIPNKIDFIYFIV